MGLSESDWLRWWFIFAVLSRCILFADELAGEFANELADGHVINAKFESKEATFSCLIQAGTGCSLDSIVLFADELAGEFANELADGQPSG